MEFVDKELNSMISRY